MSLTIVDFRKQQPILALLYGFGSAGKTSVGLTFPRLAVLASEIVPCVTAIQDHVRRGGAEPVLVQTPESRDDVFAFCDSLEKPAARQAVDSVMFDSFTDIQNRFLIQATTERVDANKQSRIPARRSNPGNVDQPEQNDWQRVLMPGLRLLIRLQELGYNVIVTAHVREWIDPVERPRARALMAQRGADPNLIPKKFYPAARGSIQDTLPHYFNLCGFMRLEPNGSRWLYTREQATFYAKTQYGALPDVITDPTYEKLLLGINGQLQAEQSAPNPWAELTTPTEGEENAISLEPTGV